jgi:hypothetical protein
MFDVYRKKRADLENNVPIIAQPAGRICFAAITVGSIEKNNPGCSAGVGVASQGIIGR